MTHKNVFQPRQSTNPVGRKRGSDLLANAMDPTKQPKQFTNKHLERKVYLQGRDRADRAIDPSFLPGGLINPSDGSVVQPIRPGTFRKSSFVPQNEEDLSKGDSLFVDENEPPTIKLPVATRADPLSKDHLICHVCTQSVSFLARPCILATRLQGCLRSWPLSFEDVVKPQR